MQCSPHDIKEQLVRALDQDYNVVDMVAVIGAIGALEKVIISKDILEKTRLGRTINELRKKTTDPQLARRAKDLVKSWRKLIPETPSGTPASNGLAHKLSSPALVQASAHHPVTTPLTASRLIQLQSNHSLKTTSPALCSSVSNSPILRTRNGTGFKPVSPAVPVGSPPAVATPQPKTPSPSLATPPPPAIPSITSSTAKAPNKKSVANKRLRKADSPPETAKRTRSNGWDSLMGGAGTQGGIPSGNSAFESIVRPDSRTGSTNSDEGTSNGGLPSRIVPKVKTTQQLIDGFKAKHTGFNVSIDDVVKEPAQAERLMTPAVAAAKGKRGRPPTHIRDSPPVTPLAKQAAVNNANFNKLLSNCDPREVSQTKSELMDRFLQSSPQSHSDESNLPPTVNGSHPLPGQSNGIREQRDVEEDIRRIMAQLPSIAGVVLEEEDTTPLFPPRTSSPTEAEVERISCGQWPCVNGNYDMHGEWKPWNQLMVVKSAGEEPLPVLPYVDIDW